MSLQVVGYVAYPDIILDESQVLQRSASRDLDLRLYDVDTGDLLGYSVLHLYTGIDLDEVVAALPIER
jgi:hypothetical protein